MNHTKQAGQTYKQLQQEHELILQAAGDGIYGLDKDGRATFVNRAAIELLGWDEDDLIGQFIHEYHHHSHADGSPYPRESCPIYAALKDGQVHQSEHEVFWTKSGQAVAVEFNSRPIIYKGEITGAVVVFRDISQRKRLQQEKEKALAEVIQLKEELEKERDYLREEIQVSVAFDGIIGNSPALQHSLEQVKAVAPTASSVLLSGETGVGKELIARALHANSSRAERAMVKVNCASIPRDLFESEFFGHKKGAFSGAHKDRTGRFQLANGGTLFLDEVGEIPLELQGKLLRALQEQEFEMVGDDITRRVDVRVIAASNRDLQEEIKAGRFRQDLYYRLAVFPIEVPALRSRQEDIVPLARNFLEHAARELGKPRYRLSRQQERALEDYHWPGNVRELKHVIERAVILTPQDSPFRLELALANISDSPVKTLSSTADDVTNKVRTEKQEKQDIRENTLRALKLTNWKVHGRGGAAELLGLKSSTLTSRMKAMGLKRPK